MSPKPLVMLALATDLCRLVACDSVTHHDQLPSLEKFEGELDFSAKGSFAKGANDPVILAVAVRDDKIRFDPPSAEDNAGGSFLIDSPGKRLYVLNGARKEAIAFDLTATSASPIASPPVVTKTGRTSVVGGFACEEWEVAADSHGKREDLCVVEKMASFFAVPVSAGMIPSRPWIREVFDGRHVPLRLISFDKTGAETGRLELTRIQRVPEDAAQFAVPEGYETVDFAQLMQGSKGVARTPQ